MKRTIGLLTLALLLIGAAVRGDDAPRKPNPFAPSLPLLTEEEEAKLDAIIDRFIQFDTGKLKGAEGKKALQDFQKLGPEAIPALIRGLNRAATIEATCPAATIGKKLVGMIKASDDTQLLDFARENIGAGVDKSPHMGIIKDLRVACMIRKRDVMAKGIANKTQPKDPPAGSTIAKMSVADLAKATASERGSKLKDILTELEGRQGELALNTLATHTTYYDEEIQKLARDLLAKHLGRQSAKVVKEKLQDQRPEVRIAAARAVGDKGMKLGAELIDLLGDKEAEVQQAARQALVKLAKGSDYGPERDAKDNERADAVKQWKAWWAKQAK
jgi:sulfur transfer complex TusBCD TusB component (DsrH family)